MTTEVSRRGGSLRGSGSVAATIAQARIAVSGEAKHAYPYPLPPSKVASLANPTRPFTPHSSQRTAEASWSTRPETPAYTPLLSASSLQTALARTGRASPVSPDLIPSHSARPSSGHGDRRTSLSRGSVSSSSSRSPRDPDPSTPPAYAPLTVHGPRPPANRQSSGPAHPPEARHTPSPADAPRAPSPTPTLASLTQQATALTRTIGASQTLCGGEAEAGEALLQQFKTLSKQHAAPLAASRPQSAALAELTVAAAAITQLCAAILRAPDGPSHPPLLHRAIKLLFGMSRDANLDRLIAPCTDPLVELLGSAAVVPLQTVGFAVSVLRNLSADGPSRELLLQTRLFPALAAVCSERGLSRKVGGCEPAELLRVVTEAVEIVRNFAASKQFAAVTDCGALMRALLDLYCAQLSELTVSPQPPGADPLPALRALSLLAVARVLSKLSSHSAARRLLASELPFLEAAVETVRRRIGNQDLPLRLLFLLGNLTVDDETVRGELDARCGCVDVLLGMLSEYADHLPDQQLAVKCVRLVANLSISPAIASSIAQDERSLALVALLERFHADPEAEELLLNTVAAITNLTVRDLSAACPESGCLLSTDISLRVAAEVSPLLFSSNAEMVVEALRCLANYSADGLVRRALLSLHVPAVLALLLDRPDPAVVFAASGVLLNMLSDPEVGAFVLEANPSVWQSAVGNLRRCVDQLDRVWALVGQLTVRCLLNIRLSRPGPGWFGPSEPAESPDNEGLEAQLQELLSVLASESQPAAGPELADLSRLAAELSAAL